jgi:hypothetical protein
MGNMISAVFSVVIVIGLFVFVFIKFVKPMMSGGRVGMQNQYMQKIIDDYQRLASTLQCDPPEVPEHQGYKAYPILTVKKDAGSIIVTATTDYWGEHERSLLYRNPYTDFSNEQRVMGAAAGQAAISMLSAATSLMGGSDIMGQHHDAIKAELLTTVKLQMPQSFRGSMILVRPETLLGKLTNLGEVAIDFPGFDRAFKVNGSNEARVKEILTPQLCEALLKLKNQMGKFQLNENYLIWAHQTVSTAKVPEAVNALLEIARIVGK